MSGGQAWLGYVCLLVAAVCFGSNFVPVKHTPTGDGVFFQWVFCASVWLFGLMVGAYRGWPEFQPIAMLGGALWCTGNLACVPAIKLIGLGLSLLIWGSSNMLMGWASGTFGLFGLKKNGISHPALNYAGVAVAMVALGTYLLVKPEEHPHRSKPVASSSLDESPNGNSLNADLMLDVASAIEDEEEGDRTAAATEGRLAMGDGEGEADSFMPHLKGSQRFAVGAGVAIGAGLFFGCSFDPAQYAIDHAQVKSSPYYGSSEDTMDYIFSHFCGIFLASLCYFLLYCMYKSYMKQEPFIYPRSVLPAFISGSLWAIAMIAWFVANGILEFSVTFPIATSTPGLVGALWGVFVFGEIKGSRNLTTLGCAFGLTVLACVLIALSK